MATTRNRLLALGLAPALALALHFEGTVHGVYTDPVGIRTDCTGHTGSDVNGLNCDAKLTADMASANAVVDSCIKAPLSGNQRAALVDFAFNVGPGGRGRKDGLCHLKRTGQPSTMSVLFNQQQYAAACNEFPKWNSQKLRGLNLRRKAEMALCLKTQ